MKNGLVIGALIGVLILLFPQMMEAQVRVAVNVMGLAFHLREQPNRGLYPLRLDESGRIVPLMGVMIGIDIPMVRIEDPVLVESVELGTQFSFSVFLDCAGRPAGFFHTGVRGAAGFGRGRFAMSFGPAWFARRSWSSIPGYVEEGLFEDDGHYQWSFYWHGGGIEYEYALTPEISWTAHLIPGIPEVIVASGGIALHPGQHEETR